MASVIPTASTKGFQNASSYDQHRPSYSAEAVNNLLKHLQVDGLKSARIVDLAAGTGKFTQLLADRDERYDIYAIEPHEGMRAELEKKRFRGVKVFNGVSNSMKSIESQSIDAVIAAQAYRKGISLVGIEKAIALVSNGANGLTDLRFANMEALEEIYRVLIPGGVFGMIWNIEDYNAPKSWDLNTKWERKLNDITWATGDDIPRFRHLQWQEVFEKQIESTPLTIQAADPLFSLPLGEDSVNFTQWLSREAVWERYHTLSQFAVLDGKELADTKKQVFEVMAGPDVETNEAGEVALHGRTISAWTTAIPGAPLKNGG